MKVHGYFGGIGLLTACATVTFVTGCGVDTEFPQEVQEVPVRGQTANKATLSEVESPPSAPAVVTEPGEQGSIESMVELALANVRGYGDGGQEQEAPVPGAESPTRLADSSSRVGQRAPPKADYGPPGTGSPAWTTPTSFAENSGDLPSDGMGEIDLTATSTLPVDLRARRSGTISDEQDFDVVSGRETIQSDAMRRQIQQQKLVVFKPSELPEKPGESSVAEFALSVSHDVGTKIYPRLGALFSRLNYKDKCSSYPDNEAAQLAFLDSGGPSTDRLGIDPDGDGFACGWTPAVYRSML